MFFSWLPKENDIAKKEKGKGDAEANGAGGQPAQGEGGESKDVKRKLVHEELADEE